MVLLFVLIYLLVSVLSILIWPNKSLTRMNVVLFFCGGFLGLVTTLLLTLLLPVLTGYLYLVFPVVAVTISITLVMLFDLIEHESHQSLFYLMPYSIIFSSLAANALALFFVEVVHQWLLGQAFGLSFMMAYLTTPLLLLFAINISCLHERLTLKQLLVALLIVPLTAPISFMDVSLALMSMLWGALAMGIWFTIMRYRQNNL